MANKVALAYMASDFLFVLMGIFMLSFSVIVENIRMEAPENGRQAARNLLYQRFPLTGPYRIVCVHQDEVLIAIRSRYRQCRSCLHHLRGDAPGHRYPISQLA